MLSIALPSPFSLADTLDCGQAFRWSRQPDGSEVGVVRDRLVQASEHDGRLRIEDLGGVKGSSPHPLSFWRSYFALDIDYAALHTLYAKNRALARCVAAAPGIRVMRQDFFEALLSIIISQNNNIGRIRGIVERLCEQAGEPIGIDPSGTPRHAFPTPHAMARLEPPDLAPIRAGYRTKALLAASRAVADGTLSEAELRSLPTPAARERLLSVYGVGPKVADCVLLFGLGRFEAFPVDVWIRRAMERHFPRGLPRAVRPTAGIAQQYIFHFVRDRQLVEP